MGYKLWGVEGTIHGAGWGVEGTIHGAGWGASLRAQAVQACKAGEVPL